jgi:hypothetical protein
MRLFARGFAHDRTLDLTRLVFRGVLIEVGILGEGTVRERVGVEIRITASLLGGLPGELTVQGAGPPKA